jgi:hypothetical protein
MRPIVGMKKRLFGSLSAVFAALGVLVATPPAQAEPSPPGCPSGYFCAYAGYGQTGQLLLSTAGNWSGYITGVHSIFNNGYPYAGADHVDLRYRGLQNYVSCFHYNPGPGRYKADLIDITITGVTWRGECTYEGPIPV